MAYDLDYDQLNRAAKNHSEHPVKNKAQLITDTVEMHEHYLSLAFMQGAEWAKEYIQKQNETGYIPEKEDSRNKSEVVTNRRSNCAACDMLRKGVKFRVSPPHTCGK